MKSDLIACSEVKNNDHAQYAHFPSYASRNTRIMSKVNCSVTI